VADEPLHRHLQRQLRKLSASESEAPSLETWRQLLEGISRTYEDTDRERYTLERSVSLFTNDMAGLNTTLEAERTRMRLLFEQAPVGMVRSEVGGPITQVNETFTRMMGYSADEIVGREPISFVHPDERAAAAASLESLRTSDRRSSFATSRRYLHKSGETIHADVSVSVARDATGTPLFMLAVIEDVTEKRQLEMELRHAQKLESVGMLAAGIAHEINTPIQFVGDNAEFLRTGFMDLLALCERYRTLLGRFQAQMSAEDREALAQAEDGADFDYLREHAPAAFASTMDGVERVAKIVKAMKTFARQDGPEKAPADINLAVRSTLTVARNELKYVADVETDLAPLPTLMCNVGDLNQVFLNLLLNAADAVRDAVGTSGARGTIRVRTLQQGSEIVIAVGDSGTGIPERIRGRIFEPFFTTKEVGRGSGQGLAISRAVVERHGGALTFDTEMGVGTTFYVRLPMGGSRGSSVQAA
jgi:PAS domain S-box-containing protein